MGMRATCILAMVVGCAVGSAHALPSVLIAETSFEAPEGYSPPGGDVRSYSPTDGAGWGGHSWAGANGGVDYTPVVFDPAGAFSGNQYLRMHRERSGSQNREIRLRRKYDTSLIQDHRIALSLAVRLDTTVGIGEGDYFAGNANIALERGDPDHQGNMNVHLIFHRNGELQANRALGGADGETLIVGKWDDPDGGFFAHNTWLTLLFDISIQQNKYDLYINDALIGTGLDFRRVLNPGEELDQFRVFGPMAFDGNPLDGISVDAVSLTTVPEPASLVLLGLGGMMLMRRRGRR